MKLPGNIGDHKLKDIVEMLRGIPLMLPEFDKEDDLQFRCLVFLKKCIRSLNDTRVINWLDADAVVNGELKTHAKENGQALLLEHSTYMLKKSKISS